MLRKISLPAWAALVLALFLLLLVVAAWLIFSFNPSHVPWRTAMSWSRIAAVLVLLILTPLVFYWTIRYWLVGYQSRFPDIDHAWQAGVKALERNGIDPRAVPIFLILGMPSPELERSLMDACGSEFAVRGVPEGTAPLHWYANADRIYLVCSEVGWLSRITREVDQAQAARTGGAVAAIAAET
jgi:hypothetical protein